MNKIMKSCLLLVISFAVFSGKYEVKAQLPDYRQLADHIIKDTHAPDSISVIVEHLKQSGTVEPIEELVRWAKEDFPEMRDKNGYWNTDASSLKRNIISSLHYFFAVSPPYDKGKRYLEIIEALKKDETFPYHLTVSAYKILSAEELEEEFFRLINLKDAEERVRGLVIGRELANKNKDIGAIYLKILKQDIDSAPRGVALGILGTLRGIYPRETAVAALERLLNDTAKNVKELAAIIVIQGAIGKDVWAESDLPLLLTSMIKSKDESVLKTLGMTVAKLTTTDSSLRIDDKKIPDNLFVRFTELAKTKENSLKRRLTDEELSEIWKNWWIPIIPKYTYKSTISACG